MKTWMALAVIAATGVFALSASAQESYQEPRREAPAAHTGFQLSLRAGAAVPLGRVSRQTAMSDFTTPQFMPFQIGVGGKIIPELYLGAYLGYQLGGPAGIRKDECDRSDGGCITGSFRYGIEAQAHLIPSGFVNPWVGYGFGAEALATGKSDNGDIESQGFGGLEFARFSAGADIRVNRIFGVGPFVDFALGRYTRTAVNDGDSQDIPSGDRRTHSWLTFGARFVFFP